YPPLPTIPLPSSLHYNSTHFLSLLYQYPLLSTIPVPTSTHYTSTLLSPLNQYPPPLHTIPVPTSSPHYTSTYTLSTLYQYPPPLYTIPVTTFFVKAEGAQEKTIVTADCCYFNHLLRRIVRFLGVYSFGLFATTIFANAGQVVTGNQTPHFLSACRPNYTVLGCQSPMQYITERRACTGNPYLVASARKSFPSKDAALSIYSAVYTMYVTLVFRTKGTRLTKPTLCLTLLSLAVLVGVVRVTEYRNHWGDVLAGYLTGGAIAAFLVTCVINNFQQTASALPPLPPLRPQPPHGMPLSTLPRVESPLEKLSCPQVRAGGSEGIVFS
uniref:Phospholipid phosphatase related 2 n=1 Tax=Hucho hucho TaxID=62062 RepID=A0A4W5MGX5_9TELE